jgi:hypothetical protein
MKRVYRAQLTEHEYFIPTAMRCHNFYWLKNKIEISQELYLDIVPKDKSNFPNPESHPDAQSVKAYYLSLKHILCKIEKNPVFKDFLEYACWDLSNIYKKPERDGDSFEIYYDEFDRCFMGIKSQLTSFEQNNGTQPLPFLKLSHHFQHFNINFAELPLVEENLNDDGRIDRFPTMCLDFSDDICTMKTFGFIGKDTALCSIDIEKVPNCLYDSYKRKQDWKLSDGVPIGENTNKLMKIQKGYCIYWPWKYSIHELTENKMFDFQVEYLE